MPAPKSQLATLLTLAWPVVVARSSQAVIGFSDALMTAPLGVDPLAAVTAGALNIFAVVMLPLGVVYIVQSFAAQLWGKGQSAAARRYGWYALVLAVVSGVLGACLIPLLPRVLSLLDYNGAVRHDMGDYLSIRLLSVAAVVGIEAIGNWYGGLGNTRVAMHAGIAAMVCNVGLNYVLIGGHLGAPALGVRGAALASAIASGIACLYVLVLFLREPAPEGPKSPLVLTELGRMLRFGFPNGLNWFLEFAAFALYINVVVAHLGTVALAALMVVFNISSVAFMPAFGLSSAGGIMVGQAIGSGRREEVPNIVFLTGLVAAGWQGMLGMVYLMWPGPLLRVFASGRAESAELVAVGSTMLAIGAAWQVFDAVGMAVSEALRAAGDTAFTLWARIALAWILFLPGSYAWVRVAGGGPAAAMLCIAGYIAALALVLCWRFRGGAWRRIDLTGAEPELV